MRVIGGSAKGRRLATLRTLALRPTPDRVREALFDILGAWIIGARVLDLFAGSGAVGIEALSRGAQAVVFVEAHVPACRVIATSLQRCGLHARATVWQADVLHALPALQRAHATFDLIFPDPPHQTALVEDTLTHVGDGALLTRDGQVVAEHFFKRPLQEHYGRLYHIRVARYGAVALSWYRLAVCKGVDDTEEPTAREALPTHASILKRAQRDMFRRLAAQLGVPFTILEVRAHAETLRHRVARRHAQADDASEADLTVLHGQFTTLERLTPEEQACALPIDTDAPQAPQRLLETVRALGEAQCRL
jgi:16S rRNA (guanine966-N2)-methyltransferase